MEKNYKYDAFISYRHLSPDKPIAERLQKLLETYVPPKGLFQGEKKAPLCLFRDESELPTSSNLGNDIKSALEQSRFLIIVCSKHYEESKWCMQELNYFKALHNEKTDHILILWVGDANTPPMIPDTLRYANRTVINPDGTEETSQEEIEPLAANVSAASLNHALKKLKSEYLRIAAPLLGCGYNDLYRREQRRRKKRAQLVLTCIITGLFLIATASTSALITISAQKRQIEEDQRSLQISHAHLLLKESKELEQIGDAYGAINAIAQALPEEGSDAPVLNSAIEQAANLCGVYAPTLFTSTKRIELPTKIQDICLFNEGERLVTVDNHNTCLWNTKTGECIKEFPDCDKHHVRFFVDREIDQLHTYDASPSRVSVYKTGGQSITIKQHKTIQQEQQTYGNAFYLSDAENHSLMRISPDDGHALWSKETDGTWQLNSVGAEGIIVISSDRITVFSPETGEMTAQLMKSELEDAFGSQLYTYTYSENRLVVQWEERSSFSFAVFQKENTDFQFRFKQTFACEGGGSFDCILDRTTLYIAGIQFDDILFVTPLVLAFDLNDGTLKWTVKEKHAFGGDVFLGLFDSLDIDGVSQNYMVAIIGEQILVINTGTGAVVKSYSFDEAFQNMYYSKNGYVFATNGSGFELFMYIPELERRIGDDHALFLNHQFNGSLSFSSYCSNHYAVVLEGTRAVSILRSMNNEQKETVYERNSDNPKAFVCSKLSPSKDYLAVQQYDPDLIEILNTETKQTVQTIDATGINDFSFFGDDRIVLVKYGGTEIVDCKTGQTLQTISGSIPSNRLFMQSSKHELAYVADSSLLLMDETLQATALIEKKEEDLGEYTQSRSVNQAFASSDFNVFLVCMQENKSSKPVFEKAADGTVSMQIGDQESTQTYSMYDRAANQFINLQTNESLPDIKDCAWSHDNQNVYLLTDENKLYCYKTESGTMDFETQCDDETVSLMIIEDTLCLLDENGSLHSVRFDGATLQKEKSIDLDMPNMSLQYETVPAQAYGILFDSKSKEAWVIEPATFEVVYKIDDYCGYYPKNNTVFTQYFNYIYAYSLLSPADTVARVNDLLLS